MTHAFRMSIVTVSVIACLTGASAQDPMQQSPIAPGFWSWPRQPTVGQPAIAEACRSKFAIQFTDGRYFGVRLQNDDNKPLRPAIVDEVGYCRFNRETQVERCELRVFNPGGTVTTGVLESRFSLAADRVIRMTVTPKAQDGTDSSSLAPFDVYPVRCPDDVVWGALAGVELPK